MVIWTLAKKDLRLLLGDRRALVILLAMPILFILVLGVATGEKVLQVSVVDLDRGMWSKKIEQDLERTAGIVVERLDLEEARHHVKNRKRAAVLVFGPDFSKRLGQCSFLEDGINPFDRKGVDLAKLDAVLLRDESQGTAANIIQEVAQVSLLRVILPWMIGSAFEKIGDVEFIDKMREKVEFETPLGTKFRPLETLLRTRKQKEDVGQGIQRALQEMFPEYNLTGTSWEDLTHASPSRRSVRAVTVLALAPGATFPANLPWAALVKNCPKERPKEDLADKSRSEAGFPSPGALRYQHLVPSYMVMFAFFLVLTVGWLFVAERRQGTLKRLRAAPLSPTQILLGKLVPCFILSLGQGLFLLAAGKLLFSLSWGPRPLWLLPVVLCTALAATGLALLIASLARTEAQVAIYGTLIVLVLAGISGCLMGDPDLMPDLMRQLSRLTPHAWALDAYAQLLLTQDPNPALIVRSCAVLTVFGAGFIALAWWLVKLD